MGSRAIKLYGTTDEILAHLAEAEHELWARGGVHGHRRRRDLLTAALDAGCTLDAIATTLGVSPSDIRAWMPAPA